MDDPVWIWAWVWVWVWVESVPILIYLKYEYLKYECKAIRF
jgi:hypothetical protein